MNKYDDVKYFGKVLVIILSSKAKIRMVIRVENIMIVKNGNGDDDDDEEEEDDDDDDDEDDDDLKSSTSFPQNDHLIIYDGFIHGGNVTVSYSHHSSL